MGSNTLRLPRVATCFHSPCRNDNLEQSVGMSGVLIRGGGVAAHCCAHLLQQAGVNVSMEAVDRPKIPAVMLGSTAQQLLSDVFARSDLFDGLLQIHERAVLWGKNAEP